MLLKIRSEIQKNLEGSLTWLDFCNLKPSMLFELILYCCILGSEEAGYKCPRCNVKTYLSRGNLNRHLKYECGGTANFCCRVPSCSAKFKRKDKLDEHWKRVHGGKYSFPD